MDAGEFRHFWQHSYIALVFQSDTVIRIEERHTALTVPLDLIDIHFIGKWCNTFDNQHLGDMRIKFMAYFHPIIRMPETSLQRLRCLTMTRLHSPATGNFENKQEKAPVV